MLRQFNLKWLLLTRIDGDDCFCNGSGYHHLPELVERRTHISSKYHCTKLTQN